MVVARSKQPLEQLSAEYPGQVKVLSGDLADFSLGQKAHELAESTWKRVDGVIVNHGILDPVKRIGQTEADAWRYCFDVNVFSAISLVYFSRMPCLVASHLTQWITDQGVLAFIA